MAACSASTLANLLAGAQGGRDLYRVARAFIRCRGDRGRPDVLDTHGHRPCVAEGAVREVLSRAKALRDAVDAASWPGHQDHRNTRLVTIGHSFGGLIVYTALSQYFIDRAVQTETAPFARSLMPERARARG
jgi:hypothetical protein